MSDPLIGTGYYSAPKDHAAKLEFLDTWLSNTRPVSSNIVIVWNAIGQPPALNARVIQLEANLGHVADIHQKSFLSGWSLSWILPALIAYNDGCDYVYKEQDCLAFGKWLERIRVAKAAFGKNAVMDCEQSLFYIERDFIPQFVQVYLSLPWPDRQILTETKFRRVMEFMPNSVAQFQLGVGRGRPLPADLHAAPWYAQHFTEPEFIRLRSEALI